MFVYFCRSRGYTESFLSIEEREQYMKSVGGSFETWDEEVIYPE